MSIDAILLPHDVALPRRNEKIQVQSASQHMTMIPASPLMEKLEYYVNGLPYDVKIVFRNGLSLIIPSMIQNVGYTKSRFMIRHDFSYRGGVKPDLQQLSGVAGNIPDTERAELVKSMNYSENILSNGFKRIMLDYYVSDELITKSENGIYDAQLDIVITRYVNRPTFHPASPEGRALALRQAVDNKKFTYDIEIIDPDDEYGHRFVNMAGEIHRIEPNKRKDIAPGVYLHAVSKDVVKETHHPFDQADAALMLFRTRDEALAYGDLAKVREKEIEKLKHDNMLLKQRVDMNSLETKERYERKSLEQKDHFEGRSFQRKDTSESIKYWPGIATAAALAVGLFAKGLLATVTSGLSFLLPF